MPPNDESSTTSGTDLMYLLMTQSCRDFSAIRSKPGLVLFTVYQYTEPMGLKSGPMPLVTPGGSVTCERRSKVFWRSQSLLELSSKIRFTTDSPAKDTDRRW